MNKVIKRLEQRQILLKNAIKVAEKDEKKFPEGKLRISRSDHQIRYYKVLDYTNLSEEYIPMDNVNIARNLAQKSYNKQFLKQARKEFDSIDKFIKRFKRKTAESIFTNLSSERQKLVTPYIITDDLYAMKWQSQNFQSNPYMPENKKYDTIRGEKVRSKSEAILADMLYNLGIPYHYEKPLVMGRGVVRYPDFTILNTKNREEIYLEHLGLLDDEEYRRGCLNKLDEYRKNSIFPGKNLILTYETSDNPLDIKGIKEMLKELFID